MRIILRVSLRNLQIRRTYLQFSMIYDNVRCHFLKSQIIRISSPSLCPGSPASRPEMRTAPPVLIASWGELSFSREVRGCLHEQSRNVLYSWSDHTAAKCGGSGGGRKPVREHLHPAEQDLLLPVQLAETSQVRPSPSQYPISQCVTLGLILEETSSCWSRRGLVLV